MSWFGAACELHRDWLNDIEGLGSLFAAHIPDYKNLIQRYSKNTAQKQSDLSKSDLRIAFCRVQSLGIRQYQIIHRRLLSVTNQYRLESIMHSFDDYYYFDFGWTRHCQPALLNGRGRYCFRSPSSILPDWCSNIGSVQLVYASRKGQRLVMEKLIEHLIQGLRDFASTSKGYHL